MTGLTPGLPLGLAMLVFLLLGIGPALDVLAQNSSTEVPYLNAPIQPSLTRQQVLAKIQEATAAPGLNPADRARGLELYRQADAALASAELTRAKTRAMRDSIGIAPQERATQAAWANVPTSFAQLGISSSASREELEQHLTRAKSGEAELAEQRAANDRQLATLRELPHKARLELEEKRGQAASLESALASPAPEKIGSNLSSAERLWREAQLEATSASVALLNQQLLSQDVRYKQLLEKQDGLKQSLLASQAAVKLISARLIESRQFEATLNLALAEQKRVDTLGKHPAVAALAERNAELTQRLEGLINDEAEVLDAARRIARSTEQLEADLKRFEQRLEIAGLNRVLGKLFIERRKRFTDGGVSSLLSDSALEKNIVDAGLGRLEVAEERASLGDGETELQRIAAAVVPPGATTQARKTLVPELRELLSQRVDLLRRLQTVYATRSRSLGELEFGRRRHESVTARFQEFLDSNLLWIPNLERINFLSLTDLVHAVAILASPTSWTAPVMHFFHDASHSPVPYLVGGVFVLTLIHFRGRMRRHVVSLNERVVHLHTDRFSYTLKTTLIVWV